jgi:hypothetical protein
VGIWKFVRPFLLPPRTDFVGLADRVPKVPAGELLVIETALVGGGVLAERLVRQLRDAEAAFRLINKDGSYEMRIATRRRIRSVPTAGWQSEPIPVRSHEGSRPLELTLEVPQAGILGVHGRALDGRPWPKEWTPDDASLAAIRARSPWLHLPSPSQLRAAHTAAASAIRTWLGDPEVSIGKRGVASVNAPASDSAIDQFERTQSFNLPRDYRELLRLANGFELGALVVLGTDDAYRLDMDGPDRLVICPPDEEGAVVLSPEGSVLFVSIVDELSTGRPEAPDLRTWVRKRL